MPRYQLMINGRVRQADLEPDTSLLWALRDAFQLCGSKYGCSKEGLCGACRCGGRTCRGLELAKVRDRPARGPVFLSVRFATPRRHHTVTRLRLIKKCRYHQCK